MCDQTFSDAHFKPFYRFAGETLVRPAKLSLTHLVTQTTKEGADLCQHHHLRCCFLHIDSPLSCFSPLAQNYQFVCARTTRSWQILGCCSRLVSLRGRCDKSLHSLNPVLILTAWLCTF